MKPDRPPTSVAMIGSSYDFWYSLSSLVEVAILPDTLSMLNFSFKNDECIEYTTVENSPKSSSVAFT